MVPWSAVSRMRSTAFGACACLLASIALTYHIRIIRKRNAFAHIRSKLPPDLNTWSIPSMHHENLTAKEREDIVEQVWRDLEPVFSATGITLWKHDGLSYVIPRGKKYTISNGFGYVTPGRGIVDTGPGTAHQMQRFNYRNMLNRMGRTSDGHENAIRVIVLNNEGWNHLEVLRKLGTAPTSLLSNNHTLPLWSEFHFHDIIFGVFPMVGAMFWETMGTFPKALVGDVVDIVMQALEGLAFMHSMKVVHQDAFYDNILIQWQPESMLTKKVPVSRPRAYWIDFEVAVLFPDSLPFEQCVCVGLPLRGSFKEYGRPHAPEMSTGQPYDPFKTDVWQLGISLIKKFKANMPEIDGIIQDMAHEDPLARPTAQEALDKLCDVVGSITPEKLLIAPEFIREVT